MRMGNHHILSLEYSNIISDIRLTFIKCLQTQGESKHILLKKEVDYNENDRKDCIIIQGSFNFSLKITSFRKKNKSEKESRRDYHNF